MLRICSAVIAALLAGCAIPVDHSQFSVTGSDPSKEAFVSSRQLLVAGLVSESLRYGTMGRYSEAEARLRKALFLEPENANVAFNLAVILGQLGDAEEAVTILERLLARSPNAPHFLVALADIRNSLGQVAEARRLLKIAFSTYKDAGNSTQAALVGRSIANLAFAEGYEQEALCYSYESVGLAPTAQHVGYHGSLLVGLNLFAEARTFLTSSIARYKGVSSGVLVHHALALAHYALHDLKEALEQEEIAQDLLPGEPELGAEVKVVWWLLMQSKRPEELSKAATARLESFRPEVLRFQEKPVYRIIMWPPQLQEQLAAVSASS